MDRRERFESLEEALLVAFQGWQAGLWSALPVIIQSFDEVAMTVTAQPAIQARFIDQEGTIQWINLPLLVDVPVCFTGGGGLTLTFPIKPNDEALIVFSSRCIDSWWQSGGIQIQAELRMHDLSDGFAIVGIRSQPRVIPNVSIVSSQLRTDTGETFIDIKENFITITAPTQVEINTTHAVVNASSDAVVNTETANINASSSVILDTPQTTCTGQLTVEGLLTYQNGLAGSGGSHGSTITGDLVQTGGVISSDGIILNSHHHTGVTTGSDDTGGPV